MAEQMVSLQSLQTSRLEEKLTRELGSKICGFLKEPHVIEIMLNPDGSLWVARLGEDIVDDFAMGREGRRGVAALVSPRATSSWWSWLVVQSPAANTWNAQLTSRARSSSISTVRTSRPKSSRTPTLR